MSNNLIKYIDILQIIEIVKKSSYKTEIIRNCEKTDKIENEKKNLF